MIELYIVLLTAFGVAWSNHTDCSYIGKTEYSFFAILFDLFKNNIVADGDILDIGANKGDHSCGFACMSPDRIVHAVDPDPNLVSKYKCKLPNFRKHVYAVSNSSGWIAHKRAKNGFSEIHKLPAGTKGNVEIQTIDYFFMEDFKSKAGFMHTDVEGFELEALQGANNIIKRDSPIFTIEIHVNENLPFTVALLNHTESLGYTIFMVNEVCGMRIDCRNFVCFPKNQKFSHGISPALDLAVRSYVFIKVDFKTIFDVFKQHEGTSHKWFDTSKFKLK